MQPRQLSPCRLRRSFVNRQILRQCFIGTVKCFEQLKKPYFSFEKEHFISIKGFAGACNVEVRYKKEFQDLVADYFHLLLYYEQEGQPGVSRLKGIEGAIREKMKTRLDPREGNST